MKDAIINAIEFPIMAMWGDESVAIPNRAAYQLMFRSTEPSEDAYELLGRFRVFTEDFKRELVLEEHPIIELCRGQKSSGKWKIGIIGKDLRQRVYDVTGQGIFDEKTKEFLAGIVALKDVTEYTELLKSQNEQNEQQFQLICDSMPQMLWTANCHGLHDWFSRRWYEYTGLTEAQSLGAGWEIPFHPDDLPETAKRWGHSLNMGDEFTMEYRCKRHDGAWRWMLGRALPLKDPKTGKIVKWFGTCTDIHDLIEAKQTATRTREQLLNVIKHAHVTVWAVDKNRTLTFLEGQLMWDESEKSITNESVGKKLPVVFGQHKGKTDLPLYMDPVNQILDGKAEEFFNEHHIDGNNRWFRSRFVPVFQKKQCSEAVDEKSIEGVIGISMDVTELKNREKALLLQEQENSRLVEQTKVAREASEFKTSFLANMSHEIRTPISGVIGLAELLLDMNLNTEQKETAEDILRSANNLLTIINDILDISKIESGRLDMEEVQFSLSIVIQDVSKMMAFAANRRNIRYESDIRLRDDVDLTVMGDPGRVRQILTNLLTNSIKFTSEGTVKLDVRVKEETADVIEIVFVVEDTGIGIEEAVQKMLFKPFSQADSSTARRFGGTGLGLTISKQVR